MKICVSPVSLKLFGNYVNRLFANELKTNAKKINVNELMPKLFKEANNLFLQSELSDEENKEILLQHFAFTPSVILKYISDNPLVVTNLNKKFKTDLEKSSSILIDAISKNNEKSLDDLFNNINSNLGNATYLIPDPNLPKKDNEFDNVDESSFDAMSRILFKTGGFESKSDNIKSNVPDLKTEFEFKIIQSVLQNNNENNLKFKLINKNEIENNPDFSDTFINKKNTPQFFLILVNENNEIAKFDDTGKLNNSGKFVGFYIKSEEYQLVRQKESISINLQETEKIEKDAADKQAQKQINDYVEFIKNKIKLAQNKKDVYFNIDLNNSSPGFINENRQKPNMLSDISNIDKTTIIKKTQGANYYPEIKAENSDKLFRVFAKPVSTLSDSDFEILHYLIQSDVIKIKNAEGNIIEEKRNIYQNSYRLNLINFYLQNNRNPGYGFQYVQIKEKGVDKFVVRFYNKQIDADKVTIDDLKSFANDTSRDKIVEKNQYVKVLESIDEVTANAQHYKENGVIKESVRPILNFSWSGASQVNSPILNVPNKLTTENENTVLELKVFSENEPYTFKDHIIKNGYIVAQLNAENKLISVGSYLSYEGIKDVDLDVNFEGINFSSVPLNEKPEQFTSEQNQDALDWFEKSLFNENEKIKLVISKNISEYGPNYLASFFKDQITLFKGSQGVDVYHESFHVYWDNILSENERLDILNSYKKNPGTFTTTVYGVKKTILFSEATPIEIEEYLAEKFKEYAATGGKKTSITNIKVLSFFQKLYAILKSLFGNTSVSDTLALAKTSAIENLIFYKLYNQKFDISKFKINNTELKWKSTESNFLNDTFSLNDIDLILTSMQSFGQSFIIEVLTYEKKDVSRMLQVYKKISLNETLSEEEKRFLEEKQKTKPAPVSNFILELKNNKTLQDNYLNFIKNNLKLRLEYYKQEYKESKLKETSTKEKITLLEKALKEENFGNLDNINNNENTTFIDLFLNKQVDFKIKQEDDTSVIFNEETNEFEEEIEDETEEYADTELYGSLKNKSTLAQQEVSVTTKNLLSNLISYDNSGKGNLILNSLGAPAITPFGIVYSKILKLLVNVTDADAAYKILAEAAVGDKIINQLYRTLGNPNVLQKNLQKQWTAFIADVGRSNQPVTLVTAEKTSSKGKSTVTIKIGQTKSESQAIVNGWKTNFSLLSITGDYGTENGFEYDALYDYYTAVSNRGFGLIKQNSNQDAPVFVTNQERLAQIKKEQTESLLTRSKYTNNESNMAVSDPITFLKEIGIIMTDSDKIRDILINGTDSITPFQSARINDLVNSLKNRKTAISEKNRKVTTLANLFKGFEYLDENGIQQTQNDLSGVLTQLRNIEEYYSNEYTNFSSFNGNGERVSEKTYYSTASLRANYLNESQSLEELLLKPGMAYLDPKINYTAASSYWFIKMYALDKTGSEYGKRNNKFNINITNLGGSILLMQNKYYIDETGTTVVVEDDMEYEDMVSQGLTEVNKKTEKGTTSLKSDKITKTVTDIYLTFRGQQEIMRAETKNTSLSIGLGTGSLQIDTETFKDIFRESYNKLLMFKNFKNYILAEVQRIQQVEKLYDLINNKTIKVEDLVLDVNQLERAQEWIQFKNILSDNTKNELLKTQLDKEISKDLQQKIENDIVEYVKEQSKDFDLNNPKLEFLDFNFNKEIFGKEEIEGNDKLIVYSTFLTNNLIQNFNYQNLFLGESSSFDIEGDSFHKRIAGLISTGKIFRNDEAWKAYINSSVYDAFAFSKINNPDVDYTYTGNINTAVMQEILADSEFLEQYKKIINEKSEKYKNIKIADGAGYITLDLYKILSESINEWSKAQDDLYNKLLKQQKGENVIITQQDLKTTFPIRKFQFFGNVTNPKSQRILEENNINFANSGLHKFALLPLIPTDLNDKPALKKLNELMMSQNIGYVTLKSASKLTTLTRVELVDNKLKKIEDDFYNGKTKTFKDIQFTVNQINVSNLKSVNFIAEGYKAKVSLPTQVRKIIMLNIMGNDGAPLDFSLSKKGGSRFEEWNKLSATEKNKKSKLWNWKSRMEKSLNTLSDKLEQDLLDDIQHEKIEENGVITYKGDSALLLAYLQKNLNSDEFLPESLSFIADKNGKLINDLSTSLIAEELEKILVSMVDKKLRKIKVTGENLINVPGAMFEDFGGSNGLNTFYLKDENGNVALDVNGKYNVVESMTVKISLQGDFIKLLDTKLNGKIIKVRNEKGEVDMDKSLLILNEAIKNEEWFNENKQFLKLPGVRIPTQGANALVAVSVGQFLPAMYGAIIILPAEIVAMSGSDYDKDTIFAMYKNTLVINNKIVEIKYNKNETESFLNLKNIKDNLLEEKEQIQKEIDEEYEKVLEKKNRTEQGVDIYYKSINERKAENKKLKQDKKKIDADKTMFLLEKMEKYELIDQTIMSNMTIISGYYDTINYIINKTYDNASGVNNTLYELKQAEFKELTKTLFKKLEIINNKLNDVVIRIESKTSKGIENEIQDLITERILMPINFKNVISPNTTDDIKDIAINAYKKVSERKKVKLNTSVFEYTVNAQKHQEYSIGIDTLGIAAVSATFYAIFSTFNASLIGATAQQEKEFKDALEYLASKDATKDILKFNKNKKIVNSFQLYNIKINKDDNTPGFSLNEDNSMSLGFQNNVDGQNIGDILSQLINAYVDIVNDPFIFKAQGTRENTPALLYMVMAGMSWKDIVSISSHPLVMEYNEIRKEQAGVFYNLFSSKISDKNFATGDIALDELLANHSSLVPNGFEYYDILKKAKNFTSDELEKSIDGDINTRSFEILAQYIFIDKLSQELNAFTQINRHDSQKISSIVEVKERILKREALLLNEFKSYDNIWFEEYDKSTVGKFNKDKLILELFSEYFKIRNNEIMLDATIGATVKRGERREKTLNQFKNDFMWFLYQNVVYNELQYTTSTLNKNLESSSYSIKETQNDEAFVIDDKTNVVSYNPNKITAYLITSGIPLNAQSFFKTNLERVKFLIEYETLLKRYNNSEVTNKEFMDNFYHFNDYTDISDQYEVYNDNAIKFRKKLLVKAALYNTSTINAMFDSEFGVAKILNLLIAKNKKALEKFKLINDLKHDRLEKDNKTNFYVKENRTADILKIYKENIEELKNFTASPQVMEFFKKFGHMTIMQSGLNAKSKYNLTQLANNRDFGDIIESVASAQGIQEMFNSLIKKLAILKENKSKKEKFAIDGIIKEFADMFNNSIDVSKIRGFNYLTNSKVNLTNSDIKTSKPKPNFDALPGKSEIPTMTYAGIGSRETPQEVLDAMEKVSKYLESLGYTLRSGAAPGADTAFEKGVKSKKEIFPGNVKTGERELKIAEEIHPAWDAMLDSARKKAIEKGNDPERAAAFVANLMARNTNQIFGKNLDTSADFVLFYAEEGKGNRPKGGTGQAVEMARRKGIPTINMAQGNWQSQLRTVVDELLEKNKNSTQSSTSVNSNDIYSQLENKNVVISNIKTKDGKYDRDANITEAKANNRVYTMEVVSDVNSFSNPWASFNRTGTIKTNSTKEAVINYIDWLTTDKFKDVKSKRKAFILDVLKSGKLKGRQLQYYAKLGEPSHATALDYLINKYDWNTQSSTSVNETTLNQIEEQIKTLPIEIFNSIDIVDNVSNDLLGNKDIFFAMKDVFEENGITDPLLINWAGINKAYFGHPKNIRSTEQLQNLIKNVYINKQIESKYLEFKKNPLALESFKSWIKALSKYPIVFQDIMLTHAIKHITNPQRKSKYVLQLSDVALTQTYGILMNKPHEANRLGKLYDQEVLKTVSDAVGHEPSASGKGYWVHIPRTKNTKFTSRITDVSNDKNAPGKFYVEYLEKGIEDSPDIDFFETREEAENFIKTLEPDNNSAQFKVNVELLRKLSPSTWCTASGMTAYYVENYDNYLLIVDGVTVAGIEAGEIASNGKVQVKEVTSRGNNGVSSIDHYDDIFAFFEKHNLDTNNDSLKNSKNAKDKGKSDKDIFQTDEEERNERIFWDRINGEIDYDPPGYDVDRYGEDPQPYDYDELYNIMQDVLSGFKTVEEVLAYENRETLLWHFHYLPQELKDNEEIANLGVEFDPHHILNISTTVPFYDELVYKAIAANVFVFPYLLAEKQLLPGLRDIYVAGIANREAAINENLLDDLPFSKTSNNLIQGYYDAINDKIVVVASNTPVNEAAKVAIHEVAHRGMLRMAKDLGGLTELGKALFAAEKQLMEKLPELLKRTGHKSLENLMLDYGFTTTSEEGKIKLLMELAARWAETLTDKSQPSWWKEFIENIKNWIKQFTGKTLSEQEVNELVGGFVKYGVKATQSSTSVKEGVLSIQDVLKEYTLEELKQGVNLRSLQDKVLKGDEETIKTAYNYLKALEKVELLKKDYDNTVEKNKEITRKINSLTERINDTIPTKVGDVLDISNDENMSDYKARLLEITRNEKGAVLKIITAKKKEYTVVVTKEGKTKTGYVTNFVFESSKEDVEKLRAEKENLKSQLVSVKDSFDYDNAFSKLWKDYFTPTQSSTSVKPDVKIISEDYGVVQAETNPTENKTQEFLDLVKPQIQAQTYKENIGNGANQMFHFGKMWSRVTAKAKPIKNNSFAPTEARNKLIDAGENAKGNSMGISEYTYAYHELDQNGNPLPSLSQLQPIIDEIQRVLGRDMSDYDSVIGNIYQPNEFIFPHKDVTESKSAKGYPVIVYTMGANAGLGIVDNNKGKMTFANQYDSRFLRGNEKLKGYTNEVLTKNGTIYTFGMDGKGRFELTHSTPINDAKVGSQLPITLPNGKVITNYTITLTFRRAADLEPGMPTVPAKITTQPSTSVAEIVNNISTPIKSKKLEYTLYDTYRKRNITKSGYKLTIPEFPNVELYLTNENPTQDSQEGSIEFNTKNKQWSIEVVHPTKGLMSISTSLAITITEVLEAFTNDINEKHSKTEDGIKVLKEIGIDFTQSSTSVEDKNAPSGLPAIKRSSKKCP